MTADGHAETVQAMRLDFTVPGEVAAISPAVGTIMKLLREIGCGAGEEFEIELAFQEALANAVVHGCREDPGKQVRISVAYDGAGGLTVVVRDPGRGFDPAALPSPVVGERRYRTHGRGVFLIQQLMDEVRFAKGGTEIRMWKRGNGAEAPADDRRQSSGSPIASPIASRHRSSSARMRGARSPVGSILPSGSR